MFKAWLKKRAERAVMKQFDAGFSYGATALLKGVDVISLEAEVENGRLFDDSPFEDGVEAAIQAWYEAIPEVKFSDPFPPLAA